MQGSRVKENTVTASALNNALRMPPFQTMDEAQYLCMQLTSAQVKTLANALHRDRANEVILDSPTEQPPSRIRFFLPDQKFRYVHCVQEIEDRKATTRGWQPNVGLHGCIANGENVTDAWALARIGGTYAATRAAAGLARALEEDELREKDPDAATLRCLRLRTGGYTIHPILKHHASSMHTARYGPYPDAVVPSTPMLPAHMIMPGTPFSDPCMPVTPPGIMSSEEAQNMNAGEAMSDGDQPDESKDETCNDDDNHAWGEWHGSGKAKWYDQENEQDRQWGKSWKQWEAPHWQSKDWQKWSKW